jgi:hypothetical protein
MAERPCASCAQVVTADPSGFCEDCQQGIPSQKPGSLTPAQRDALVGLLMDEGMVPSGRAPEDARKRRAGFIASVIPGWKYADDLGALSQQQAEDLIAALLRRREAGEQT